MELDRFGRVVDQRWRKTGDDKAHDIALQSDGKIVIVGNSSGGDVALARLNTNGSLDTSFSFYGKLKQHFGSSWRT